MAVNETVAVAPLAKLSIGPSTVSEFDAVGPVPLTVTVSPPAHVNVTLYVDSLGAVVVVVGCFGFVVVVGGRKIVVVGVGRVVVVTGRFGTVVVVEDAGRFLT